MSEQKSELIFTVVIVLLVGVFFLGRHFFIQHRETQEQMQEERDERARQNLMLIHVQGLIGELSTIEIPTEGVLIADIRITMFGRDLVVRDDSQTVLDYSLEEITVILASEDVVITSNSTVNSIIDLAVTAKIE